MSSGWLLSGWDKDGHLVRQGCSSLDSVRQYCRAIEWLRKPHIAALDAPANMRNASGSARVVLDTSWRVRPVFCRMSVT